MVSDIPLETNRRDANTKSKGQDVIGVTPENTLPYDGPTVLAQLKMTENWADITAAAKSGFALTGSTAMGHVGPIIGLMDVGECEDLYLFRVALPGVKRDDSTREVSTQILPGFRNENSESMPTGTLLDDLLAAWSSCRGKVFWKFWNGWDSGRNREERKTYYPHLSTMNCPGPTQDDRKRLERDSPAIIFLPSQPSKQKWADITAAAKSGFALTGSTAMGHVGPIIGLMDVGECEDLYLFRVALPGVKRDDSTREVSTQILPGFRNENSESMPTGTLLDDLLAAWSSCRGRVFWKFWNGWDSGRNREERKTYYPHLSTMNW
ncbi:hypothetical protein Dsin_022522 [Dipteronia sinensis]|uniref:Uncharacterized protein n=1 Tax=Dipteronia sinensis TaxID=43782 RepID=A0AAE0E182_9ROSI|nr:hypothetical protein Dsin_022522 [Dipteronia sinensis]